MSTRSEREKNKRQHEKHLGILMELLREDQNKYCADCRSKGPRWASWNLGIFVCITCAGIHRNLGVHISRVKSVNLDAWTPEQTKNIQEWGNRRANQYYEYNLPADFKRPQGDSALEHFIRNKYEKKLYISKAGPPPPCEVKTTQEKTSKEKKKTANSENKKVQQISRPEPSKPVKNNEQVRDYKSNKTPGKSDSSNTADLLSLSEAAPPQNSTLLSMSNARQQNTADLLNFGSPSVPNNPAPPPSVPTSSQSFGFDLVQTTPNQAPVSNPVQPASNGMSSSGQTNLEEDLFKSDLSGGNQSTKDSIMALYQPSQQQSNRPMFGIPGGVYLQQQSQPNVAAMNMNVPNTMAPQYNTQFNPQQQQMYQVNQVQQQMAKLGFTQKPTMSTNQAMLNGQVMPNNQAMPNMQVMQGYTFNQAVPGMASAPYRNTTPLGGGNWMAQNPGNFAQRQPVPQYLTTGPAVPGFGMYQGQGGMPSGQTLSTNLWK